MNFRVAWCRPEIRTCAKYVRAAMVGMDTEERQGLFVQLKEALRVIMAAEAAAQDDDHNEDRWIETQQ
jgi:hypothetical protein